MSSIRTLLATLLSVILLLATSCQAIEPPSEAEDDAAAPVSELFIEAAARAEMEQGLSAFYDFMDQFQQPYGARVDDLDTVIAHFDAAIALQPDWAEAYVCRAYAASTLSIIAPGLQSAEEQSRASACASADLDRALALDPELADAYVARAHLRHYGVAKGSVHDRVRGAGLYASMHSDLAHATVLAPSRVDVSAASLLMNYNLAGMGVMDTDASIGDISAIWQQLYELYESEPEVVEPYFACATMLYAAMQRSSPDPEWVNTIRQAADDALVRDPGDAYGHLLRGLAGVATAQCRTEEMDRAIEEIGVFFTMSKQIGSCPEDHSGYASSMLRRYTEYGAWFSSAVLGYICSPKSGQFQQTAGPASTGIGNESATIHLQ